MAGSKFSAVDATLGYAYQVRCALLYALRHARDGDEFEVSLEALDDVTFSAKGGDAFELLQLKHHLTVRSTLNDAGEDLWKTIRVWVEGYKDGTIPPSSRHWLVTTAAAQPGSVASYLRASKEVGRNVQAALDGLNTTAATSSSQANALAYGAWTLLAQDARQALIDRAFVLDGQPTILDLDAELAKEVWGSAERDHIQVFLEYLEGWWFLRVIRQLTGQAPAIESGEIDLKIDELREQFRRENLPVDEDLLQLELDDALMDCYQDHTFVRQLQLVTDNARRIGNAVRDFFRAYEQRSRWIRRHLVLDMEMGKYERHLVDEWARAFDQLSDEMEPGAAEDLMRRSGVALLTWAENALLPVRPHVTEGFISRGSFHMLADERKVGWHPDFQNRLAGILSQPGSAS